MALKTAAFCAEVKIDEKQHVIHAVFFDRLRYICKNGKKLG